MAIYKNITQLIKINFVSKFLSLNKEEKMNYLYTSAFRNTPKKFWCIINNNINIKVKD